MKISKSNILKLLNKAIVSFYILAVIIVCMNPFVFSADMSDSRKQEIQQKAEKILSSKEFAEKEQKKTIIETMAVGVKEIIERIMEKVKELMQRLKLPQLNSASSDAKLDPVSAAVLKIIGIIIIIVAILTVFYIASKNFRSVKKVRTKEDQELLFALKDVNLVEEKVFDYADKGDYRQAIRYLYIAFLLRCNERNLIKIEKSKTNKQYLHELREAGFNAYSTVSDFTHDFNKYWYGNRTAEKNRFDYWSTAYDLLKKEVSQ